MTLLEKITHTQGAVQIHTTHCPWRLGKRETESGAHSSIIKPVDVMKLSRHM